MSDFGWLSDPFSDDLPSLEEVVAVVVEHSGAQLADLAGPSCSRPLVGWRQVAMAACRIGTTGSLNDIGDIFDRHHTTVLHGVRRVMASAQARPVAERIASEARARHAAAQQQELFACSSIDGAERGDSIRL